MKKLALILQFIVVFLFSLNSDSVYAQALIINHEAVEHFDLIPLDTLNYIRNNYVVNYTGASHGNQVPRGMYLLSLQNPSKYAIQHCSSPAGCIQSNALKIISSWYHVQYGWQDCTEDWSSTAVADWRPCMQDDSQYWSTQIGRESTIQTAYQSALAGAPLTVSIWCWCWDICNPNAQFSQSNDFTTEHIQWYLDDALYAFNHDSSVNQTKFVYHTSVSDCSSAAGTDAQWRVTYFNDVIRQAAVDDGGVLFDQADIENWNINNTQRRIETDGQGRTVYLRHADYDEKDNDDIPDFTPGHSNEALCLRKAKALWVLLARLSGWNPVITSTCAELGGTCCSSGQLCQGGTWNNSSDCSTRCCIGGACIDPGCGNGVVEEGETCDPPATCPTSCNDGDVCTSDTMTGSASTCNAACHNTSITSCTNADGCCPQGCNSTNDNNCAIECGNGVIETGETCDPPNSCPNTCNDENACTNDIMTGSAANCNTVCSNNIIVSCNNDDGCCPSGCDSINDNDCSTSCGNHVVDQGETCDPSKDCPIDCDDQNNCTIDQIIGSAANCNVVCLHKPIVLCNNEDGCCPAGCDSTVDNDCIKDAMAIQISGCRMFTLTQNLDHTNSLSWFAIFLFSLLCARFAWRLYRKI